MYFTLKQLINYYQLLICLAEVNQQIRNPGILLRKCNNPFQEIFRLNTKN